MSLASVSAGFAGLVMLTLVVSACTDSGESAPAGQEMPAPQVSVYLINAERLPISYELPGRVAPTRIAQVRPRVSGIVVERVFQQGSLVKEGDVLYRIDDAAFRMQVASAEATLRRARAVQLQAQQEADRQQ